MAEQVRVEEVVTTIMYGLSQVIAAEAKSEQERMNEAQQVLYMTLCHMQMYVEETALSTQLDNSAEWGAAVPSHDGDSGLHRKDGGIVPPGVNDIFRDY